jgi:phosphatidylserine decarboxylase
MGVYRYPFIAREGWFYLGVTIGFAVILYFFYWILAVPALLAIVWLVIVFRDPPRTIPSNPLAIVSPVDGKVLSVDQVYDAYTKRRALRIIIKMRWFDVYSLRSPTEGKIVKAWHPDTGNKENSPIAVLWIQTDEKDNVVTSILGGFWLWKPVCETQSGERVGQGQRCGFMRFGNKVELMLPNSAIAKVKTSDKVVSGESVVANLIHEP